MIEKLGEKQVFDAQLSIDKKMLTLTDGCDMVFEASLTKTEVIELANDFMKLAEEMTDDG